MFQELRPPSLSLGRAWVSLLFSLCGVYSDYMTEGEQERELGKIVLKSVLKLHDQEQHDEGLSIELDKLPDNEITSTFRGLVEAKADIERLRRDLGLHHE